MASFSGSGRGGWAPRRGRGRGGRAPHFAKNREQPKPDLQTHPLGDPVKVFRSSDLSLKPIDSAEISNCQHVASYNWLNDEVPTIVVPGKPPRWTPLQAPQRLKEDDGQYFRDPNAAKYPDFPMAPVVHAITETDPEFDATNTDVFACGSTLGNLLRFARGVDKAFRFNIEVIGETVFFVRKENDPKEVIKDIRGFGHTFPEAYTTWEHSVKGSETHQRIIRYEFGGLECLVRFESDGYIDDSSAVRDVAPAQTAADQDELLQAFQQAAIGRPPSNTTGKPVEIKTRHGGSAVPHHSVFDLKTRSGKYKKPIDMTDIYPALWMKQISNFIVAYHDGHGLFEDIQVQDVKSDVRAWVRDNRDGIRRFATLLNEIVDIAKSSTNKLLEVYCPGADRLEVRSQYGDGVHALPADLVERWEKTETYVSSTQDDASDEDEYNDGGVDIDARYGFGNGYDDDSGSEPDYTACSAEDFGKTFCDSPFRLQVNKENKKQIGKDTAVIYRDELVPRLQHIQDLNSALHGFLQKSCTTHTNFSNSELEKFQEKVKVQDYFYQTIAMLSTHVQSIRMELQHLGAQVGAALLLTDFDQGYFAQWDIDNRTPYPLTAAITNARRDIAHIPGVNNVYDE
ncbi:uncharacterized protein J4E84_008078 [Alternaria hordeiaustralica]|uniref:uncharacterized protein n=1 Tax=Alternaria hordeiaustralica TaxID=1187925 RepID=UPI0020C1D7B9|nr:uncharacterized protein J4E84_008078 [Alternaria hordeiaustralica]KAI4680430.1 hypothetical protein J4E84_008078 [Alternaria hordeiaustralica]